MANKNKKYFIYQQYEMNRIQNLNQINTRSNLRKFLRKDYLILWTLLIEKCTYIYTDEELLKVLYMLREKFQFVRLYHLFLDYIKGNVNSLIY